MRMSICAQSMASVPPAPAWTLKMASAWSYSPLSSVESSRRSTARSSCRSCSAASCRDCSSSSSTASSTRTSRSSHWRCTFSHCSTSRFKLFCCLTTWRAVSGSLQKSAAAMCSSSLAASARFLSTSKVDPHFADPPAQILQFLPDLAHVNRCHNPDLLNLNQRRRNRANPGRLAGIGAAALLVLLPAAAGARVVAPHLGLDAPGGRALDRLPARAVIGGPGQEIFPLLPLGRGLHLHPHPEEGVDRILLHGAQHVLEHLVGLKLVLEQRVLLAVRPQADAFPQVVHGPQVLHPLHIDEAQQEVALHLPHELGTDLPLPGFVGSHDRVLKPAPHRVAVQPLKLLWSDGHMPVGQLLHPLAEGRQIPLVRMHLLVAVRVHVLAHEPAQHLDDVFPKVFAQQNLAALLVDDFALLVHDVVELQHLLAQLKVAGLHLLLGVLDGPAH